MHPVETHAILICDGDADARAALRGALRGHHVTEAATQAEALGALRAACFDAVLSGGADGVALLQVVRLQWPDTLRILILEPWSPDTLRTSLDIALHSRAQRAAAG